jgi:aminoglycoside phosphotransferase (APT) family kinase protein
MDRMAGIVDALEARLGARGGEPVPLEGGITNRNFHVELGGDEYVVRLCGKDTEALGIDRATECLAAERAAELGIGPRVALRLPDENVLVTAFVTGHTADAAALREPAVLARVAAALRAFHGGPAIDSVFDVPVVVGEQREVVLGRGGSVPPELDQALAVARRIQEAVHGPDHEPVPCHNDLLSANFILERDALHIVDWEYAGMNDRFFDLGNFAVNNELGDDDARRLLHAYFDAEPTHAQLAALALFRYVSDLREAMWGVVQTVLSDLDFDYRAYAAEHLERMGRTAADPRFEEWMAVVEAA